jgi:hypothetical protein
VEAIYAGQPFRTVLRDLGLTPNQVWGLTKTDQEWSAELEAALTATRRDDLEHGATAASYVAGCLCAECREHQRTPPNAATWMSPSPNSARSPTAATTSWPKPPALTPGLGTPGRPPNVGIELPVAGMLIMAGGGNGTSLDYDELERWTRVGLERGMRSRKGER